MTSDITFRNELLRKGIHLSSLAIPAIYTGVDQALAIALLAPLAVVSVVVDILSHTSPAVGKIIGMLFGHLLRPHELRNDKILLNGASYVLISALLCVVIFPKIVMITAFSVLIVSDTAAALFGRRFGRHTFFDKSLEGAIAFTISAVGVVCVIGLLSGCPAGFYAAGIAAGAAGAVVEAASIRLRFDDNLSIPLSVGTTLLLGDAVFVQYFGAASFADALP